MKENIGTFFTITGVVGIMFFGYQYYMESESFRVFGTDITIATGDYTHIITSAVVLIIGILISRFNLR